MRALFIVAFLMTSLLMTRSVDAQEVLTNQSVVEMVKAGLSERVIIAKIRNSPTNFDTQTDALIALKKNGVPEKVIEAIMSPSAPAAVAAPPASSAPAGSVAMAPPPAASPARPTVSRPASTGSSRRAAAVRWAAASTTSASTEGVPTPHTNGRPYRSRCATSRSGLRCFLPCPTARAG